jgi:16S rRNA (guanine527-N7)-methyltransferase
MQKLLEQVRELLGVSLTQGQLGQFKKYQEELLLWNEKFNLTAIVDDEGIRVKHFLDSLSCALVMGEKPPRRLVDIGTGAGFPGVPLKILFPDMQLTLVESVAKKAEFCRHITQVLGLEGVQVLSLRAEETGQRAEHREQYDWATARAVAALLVLAEYLLPLVNIGGQALAQKGESGPAEAQQAENAFRILGGRLKQVRKINLPGVTEDRYLVVIEKVARTPSQYPRRVGVPAKKPL